MSAKKIKAREADESNVFSELEAGLSHNAKHAYETYCIAFWRDRNEMTVGDMRRAIRALYGSAIDDELERHLEARRNVILPAALNRKEPKP